MTMTDIDLDLDDSADLASDEADTEPEGLRLGADVYLTRCAAVLLAVCGAVALLFSQVRWAGAVLICAAVALLYAQAAAWADRRAGP